MAWSRGHEPRRKISGRDTAYGVSHRTGRLGWFPGLALGQAGRVALMLCATEFELCRLAESDRSSPQASPALSMVALDGMPLRGFGDLL